MTPYSPSAASTCHLPLLNYCLFVFSFFYDPGEVGGSLRPTRRRCPAKKSETAFLAVAAPYGDAWRLRPMGNAYGRPRGSADAFVWAAGDRGRAGRPRRKITISYLSQKLGSRFHNPLEAPSSSHMLPPEG